MVTSIHISRGGGIATERATRADDEYLRYPTETLLCDGDERWRT